MNTSTLQRIAEIVFAFREWLNFSKKTSWLFTGHEEVLRFLSQPFHVAYSFGIPGVLVPSKTP
jgi:hypothetical protein